MTATTISNQRMAAPSSHDQAAAAVAPAYGFVARIMRRAVSHHVRVRVARELHSLPAEIRSDIGVPEHAIEEIAAAAATRKADVLVRRVFGRPAARLAA